MVDLAMLQVVRDLVAIFGVIAGFSYYVMTVRNSQRMQIMQLETRQAQLFMQIYSPLTDEHFNKMFFEVLNYQWEDYEDYNKNYLEEKDARSKLGALANYFEGIGVLVKRGLIDVSFVDDLMSGATLLYWEKLEEVVKEQRRRDNWPQMVEYAEYLYEQVRSIVEDQHPEIVGKRFGVHE
jgi:hypothetical protein